MTATTAYTVALIRVSVGETDVRSTAAPCNIGNAAADYKTRACMRNRTQNFRARQCAAAALAISRSNSTIPRRGENNASGIMNQSSDSPILAPIFHERPTAI